MNYTLLSRWLRSSAAMLTLLLAAAAWAVEPAPPQIIALRTNRTSLLVTVKVPKGWQAVKLQSRESANSGAWVPRAIIRPGHAAGQVVCKLPVSLTNQLLQVEGVLQEPLAKSFYQGRHSFARHKTTFWQPDQGRGEVLSVGANAALPAMGGVPAYGAIARSVVESDIWKVSGDTLYFFNQMRGLQVIDISQPDAPVLRSTLPLPAQGEDMYLLDAQHVVLLTRNACDNPWGSQLVVVDVSGATPQPVASVPLSGAVEESRLVGNVLYIAGAGPDPSLGTNAEWSTWGTLVASVNFANPAAPAVGSPLWISGTGNAVLATDRFLFVATTDRGSDATPPSQVHVVDISAGDGSMHEASSITSSGNVEDKSKMYLNGDVFTVISDQYNDGPDGNGAWSTTLQTFSLANPASPAALGSLNLAPGEYLYATRFDGNRAYVVTAQSVDPLFILDLSDPAHPAVAGSLEVPGIATDIIPMGNRLLTLGYGSNWWEAAVSLFDVTNATNVSLLSRVDLGSGYSSALWDNMALTVLSDPGLVLLPYQGDASTGWANGVQLIDLGPSSLTLRGFINQRWALRRTTAHNGRLLSLSNQDLLTVDASNEDSPVVTQDTPLAWPVDRVLLAGSYLLEIANGTAWGDSTPPTVRVASAADPNTILNSLTLSNLPIVGVTLRSNRLYVLQSPAPWYGGPMPAAPGFAPQIPAQPGTTALPQVAKPSPTNLLMTIADVSGLPNFQVLSQLSFAPSGPLGGSYEALWPKPEVLVWFSTGFGYWINPLVDELPIHIGPASLRVPLPGPVLGTIAPLTNPPILLQSPPMPTLLPAPVLTTITNPIRIIFASNTLASLAMASMPKASVAGSVTSGPLRLGTSSPAPGVQPFLTLPYWWPWWNNGGARLLTLNVSDPANPQFVSRLNFQPTNAWGFSQAQAAQGLVYFTHEQPTQVGPVQPLSNAVPANANWRVNELLDVVDLTDATTPTVRPPVEVPGQLAGLSEEGSVVYLLGNAGACAGAALDTREAVNACAYDGVAAYVLDSLPLPRTWPRPVLVSHDVVYLACTTDNSTNGTLQSWTLSDAGKFSRQATLQVSQSIWALGLFHGLLAGQTGRSGVSLFDASSPSMLRLVGHGGPAGCLWFNLNNADGALNTGLYLPLDDYGVEFVPVGL